MMEKTDVEIEELRLKEEKKKVNRLKRSLFFGKKQIFIELRKLI